ncbi:uncharacterized protein PFLUO_LOCUS4820 [Penicillium psychrofluorescens]|uniref:uncharacterized protein n=1 Tax=Penicillium psychrofluorescens TaxID=3158075 RepID=UPI003CCCB242
MVLGGRILPHIESRNLDISASLSWYANHPASIGNVIVGLFGLSILFVILYDLAYFFRDPHHLRRFPAPSCAGLTNLWSAYHSRRLQRSRAVLRAHQNLGPIIRIQPKHISFADPRAVQDIYGHGTSVIKSTFYKTISGGDSESIVSTLDRDDHARKRRYISNAFSQRNVISMEPLVAQKVHYLLDRLDRAAEFNETVDIRQWLNFFTFDVISAMALGNDPDLLHKGEDRMVVETLDGKSSTVDPIRSFQSSTVHVAFLGHWPELLNITKKLTKWWPNSKSGDNFEAMCVQQIRQRLQKPKDVSSTELPYGDFFQHLLIDSKGEGRGLPFRELVQEVAVFLSAGSDTTASSMTNNLYLLMKHSQILDKLRTELDESTGEKSQVKQAAVIPYARASQVKYLRACVDEGLRHLTPTSVGLQRMTPPKGAEIAGHWITGGITVSVPTYTLHHDPDLFPEPFCFKPERWLEGTEQDRENLKAYFIPFTVGRHSCIGRNIAYLEQYVVLSTLVSRYDFEFAENDFELLVLERINANPGAMPVKVRRRG